MKNILASLLSLPIAAVACASNLDVEDRPCPCAAGWLCCEARNICMSPGQAILDCPDVEDDDDAGGDDAGVDGQEAAARSDGGLADLGSMPIELASDQSVRCMTADRDHVYWMNADGRLSGAPKMGGPIQTESAPGTGFTPRCSLAIEHGLWLWRADYEKGWIYRDTLRSNGEWKLERGTGFAAPDVVGISSLAVDDEWIYVTEYDVGRITKVARKEQLGYPREVVVLAKGREHPDGVVEDGGSVYWIDRGADPSNFGAIMMVAKAGGSGPVKLAEATRPGGLVVHGPWVYWTQAGYVMKIPKIGGVASLVSDEQPHIGGSQLGGIMTDGTSLFWAIHTYLRQALLEGGAAVDVTPVQGAPLVAFTVDARWFTWSDGAKVWSRARSPFAQAGSK